MSINHHGFCIIFFASSNQTSEFAHSQREEVQRKGLGRKSGRKIQNRGFMGLE